MQGNIFKIKKDKIKIWKKWSEYLISQKDKVVLTLEEENIIFEGSFIFTIGEDDFVCLYARANPNGMKGANLEKEINNQHRAKIQECFEGRVSVIENLYLFEANN